MVHETVTMEGHLIDSDILRRAFARIVEDGGEFEVLEFKVGKTNEDASFARLSFVLLMSSMLCCGGAVPSAAALMYVFSSGNCAATCCAVAATVQPSGHVACHLSSGMLSTVCVSSPSTFSN